MLAPEVASGCAQVDSAFDALASVDVSALADDELHHYVMELQRLSGRLVALRSGPVGEWDARGVWADDGSRASWARLGREAAKTSASAKAEIGRARKLRRMPVTAAAFAAGTLSIDQVELLCEAFVPPIAAGLVRDEQLLRSELSRLPLSDGRRCSDYG